MRSDGVSMLPIASAVGTPHRQSLQQRKLGEKLTDEPAVGHSFSSYQQRHVMKLSSIEAKGDTKTKDGKLIQHQKAMDQDGDATKNFSRGILRKELLKRPATVPAPNTPKASGFIQSKFKIFAILIQMRSVFSIRPPKVHPRLLWPHGRSAHGPPAAVFELRKKATETFY